MSNKYKKDQKKSGAAIPSMVRGTYIKAYVRVAVPAEVKKWQRGGASDIPYRQVSQERAAEITGKSAHTVRRWANGHQPVDVTSLRLLQIWVWGIIPAPAFIAAGIFIAHDQSRFRMDKAPDVIATDNGYCVSPSDLQSFGWLQKLYQDRVTAQDRTAAEAARAALPTAKILLFSEHVARRKPITPDKDQA